MQGDGYSSVQPYDPHTQSYAPSDQSMQGLPNGAKIVAEYFLGYLDDQQQQQQSQYPQVYQQYQPCIPCVPCEPIQQQVAQQQPDYSTTSSASLSSKEEVEIEIWEKNKKDKESKKEKVCLFSQILTNLEITNMFNFRRRPLISENRLTISKSYQT